MLSLSKARDQTYELTAAQPKSKKTSRTAKIAKILEMSKGEVLPKGDIITVIDRALIPWVERSRGDGQPGDDAYWVGEDVYGFKAKADLIKDTVLKHRGNSDKLNEIHSRLVRNMGYGPKQAEKEIENIEKGNLRLNG